MTEIKNENKDAKITYTCPMHPEVKVDKPGKCPKCGMDLIEKKQGIYSKYPGNIGTEKNFKQLNKIENQKEKKP